MEERGLLFVNWDKNIFLIKKRVLAKNPFRNCRVVVISPKKLPELCVEEIADFGMFCFHDVFFVIANYKSQRLLKFDGERGQKQGDGEGSEECGGILKPDVKINNIVVDHFALVQSKNIQICNRDFIEGKQDLLLSLELGSLDATVFSI